MGSSLRMLESKTIPKSVGIWLLIGVLMVLVQIFLGGVTRLTNSGLSITEWDIVTGTLPPLNAEEWNQAFELYKAEAKVQVDRLNPDITMGEFKYIYFWEYFHRLWARIMGFVFVFPFIYFWRRGYFSRKFLVQLGKIVVLATLVASAGWIMVLSGLAKGEIAGIIRIPLEDGNFILHLAVFDTLDSAWVNGYKLTIHLSLAVLLLGYLFWLTLQVLQPNPKDTHHRRVRRYAWRITWVIGLQIIFGGFMSGMKAGLFYPNFPHMEVSPDGAWVWVAEVLKDQSAWNWSNVVDYDNSSFASALVQLLHRGTAYLLCLLILVFFFTLKRIQISATLRKGGYVLISILIIQVLLGVFTLIHCQGTVPVALGVLHQFVGVLLFLAMLFVNYQFKKSK